MLVSVALVESYRCCGLTGGRVELIQSPADHSQVTLQLKILTNQADMN